MIVLLRGGGDLASGVALRLQRAGLRVVITELPHPLTVRRLVAFSAAVTRGETAVEGVTAQLVAGLDDLYTCLHEGTLPVLVDPQAEIRHRLKPSVLVDGRMRKAAPELGMQAAPLVIGLGPGFSAGENCHAVIETKRGHTLGRVIWKGPAEPDTGLPEAVLDQDRSRVLRAPRNGVLEAHLRIGEQVSRGQAIAVVAGETVHAPFAGVLRGLLIPGTQVEKGMKIGDVDPRAKPEYTRLVSDKALAVGGGVLEAILSTTELRPLMWD
jgi:xanthine dehydrogenase accessory factor